MADGLTNVICLRTIMCMKNAPTIIAFASGKGGVGKSTSCLGLAGALCKRGNRVHVVDFDQTNTLWNWYTDNADAKAISNLSVEKAPDAASLDTFVYDLYTKREGYILIDLAGSLTEVMVLVAAFASLVIIPTKLGVADILEAQRLNTHILALGDKLGKPVMCRLLLNELPFVFGASQLHILKQVEGMGLTRFMEVLHARPAYVEPHLTGLPLHYGDLERSPIRKAVDEIDLLLDEVLRLIRPTAMKAAA